MTPPRQEGRKREIISLALNKKGADSTKDKKVNSAKKGASPRRLRRRLKVKGKKLLFAHNRIRWREKREVKEKKVR